MRWHGLIIIAASLCIDAYAADTSGAPLSWAGEPSAPTRSPGTSEPVTAQEIERTANSFGAFSPELETELVARGRQLLESGDLAAAEDSLRRAQSIIHHADGVHSLKQVDILDLMTELYLARDEPFEADREQQMALFVAEHNFDADDPQVLPALYKLADWYESTGQYNHARDLLERAIRLITAAGGPADPRLVPPLIRSAKIRRMQRICCSYRALEAAQGIVNANPGLAVDARVEVMTALGDAYTASGKDDQAAAVWKEIWTLLGDDVAGQKFGEPVQIAMSRDLAEARLASLRVFKPAQEFGVSGLRELTAEERLVRESSAPQLFLVPMSDDMQSVQILEDFPQADDDERVYRMVGHPYRFVLQQLQAVLPLRLQSVERLARITLQADFTVDEEGRVSDVNVVGNGAPSRLVRVVRESVYKSRFRPRLVKGEPVATRHVTLEQRFDR
ncbi:MAG: hypothetical protein KDI19_04255 [Pseudomonadales bacterium]|nr:hypothetical protein [Pseudomonadales bacterium]